MAQWRKKQGNKHYAEETGMKYVSRIVEVDGKVIYNNKDWWTKEAPYIT